MTDGDATALRYNRLSNRTLRVPSTGIEAASSTGVTLLRNRIVRFENGIVLSGGSTGTLTGNVTIAVTNP